MVTNVAFDSLRPDVLPKRVARFKALSFGGLVMKPVRHKLRFWVAPEWKIQACDVKVEAWGFGFGDPKGMQQMQAMTGRSSELRTMTRLLHLAC